ncbi:unnamed protein product [Calicophoron daubneyi]
MNGTTEQSVSSSTENKSLKASNNPFGDHGGREQNSAAVSPEKQEKLSVPFLSTVSDLLAQVQRLMEPMMSAYGSIPSVAGLSQELDKIHSVLAGRLTKDLKILLVGTRNITEDAPLIQSACQLIELLPKNLQVKSDLLNWFIGRQLGEYKELFDPTQTTAWLDKIDHRYSWLRSNLPGMERRFQLFFPPEWHVTEQLIVEFCRLTKNDLDIVMKRRQAELTHNLIIFGLQRTLAFETTLNKVYSGFVPSEEGGNLETTKPKETKKSLNPFDEDEGEESNIEAEENEKEEKQDMEVKSKQPFDGLISSCFDPHFDLYLNHVEKALREQLENRLIGDFTVNKSSLTNRDLSDVFKDDSSGPTVQAGLADSGENTLYSATDLFLMFKQVIKQTLQLNRSQGLLGLVRLLRQYLSEYTVCVLIAQIPGLSVGSNTSGGSSGTHLFTPEVSAKMAAFGLSGLFNLGIGRGQSVSGTQSDLTKSASRASLASSDASNVDINQLFASLLRDDPQTARLTAEDTQKVCVVLVTAAFCLKTVEDLEKRLKLEVRPAFLSSQISFAAEIDGFAACRSICVHRLVSDLEAAVEPQLAAMARLPWNSLLQVGDQSVYVTEIVKHLRSQVPPIRDTLYSVRAAFTQICIKFAGALITRFIASLYRCKPVNTFGAEQLLLDTQSLKSALLQMPVFGAKFSQVPPRSFTNLVQEGMGRAERIIKAVMLPVGTPGLAGQTAPVETGPSAGFVMGPVDKNAAELFLTSYRQLLPDATPSDLQKVLDMKGVKFGELQLILDVFRNYQKESNVQLTLDDSSSREKLNKDRDDPEKNNESKTHPQQPSVAEQPTSSRLLHFEKLVMKRR